MAPKKQNENDSNGLIPEQEILLMAQRGELSPEQEKFKYEVAQEIGAANRKHKNFPKSPQA